jgi:phospholipid/cholesterol/gamma-HCH transport system permease protein
MNPVNRLGRRVIEEVAGLGRFLIVLVATVRGIFLPPYRVRATLRQMHFAGVKSFFVVSLTGTFTGMVLALQSYHAFRIFGGEAMVGATVALSMCRELGPVLTALMVTARAGSAMAAQIGTMRVTEQIDALQSIAVDPVEYLFAPRIVASLVMLPILTVYFDFLGILGGYFVGVKHLGIPAGPFVNSIVQYTDYQDLTDGLIKSLFFGLILSVISCYKGYTAGKGAEGVGWATTEAVVLSSVLILVSDYFLTDWLF